MKWFGRGKGDGAPAAPAPPSPEAAEAARAARAEAEAHFARRDDEAECRAALAAWERALAADPGDQAALLGLSRGFYHLAELAYGPAGECTERGAAKLQAAAFESGAQAGERGVRARGHDVHRPAALGTEDLPIAFWWAQNAILAANAKGVAATVRQFNPVLKVMERVAALDSGFWYGAPDRYLATVFCTAPGYAGGDLQKGRRHFEASLRYAPDFMATRVLFAKFYARPARDQALHQELLRQVLETPIDVLPEVIPEQKLAQKRAQGELARDFSAKR